MNIFPKRKHLRKLFLLKINTIGKTPKWIEGVFARQHGPNLRPKAKQRKDDDRIYFHIEIKEDELDFDIDTQKSHKRKGSKGKKQADTGNIIINLFITI